MDNVFFYPYSIFFFQRRNLFYKGLTFVLFQNNNDLGLIEKNLGLRREETRG